MVGDGEVSRTQKPMQKQTGWFLLESGDEAAQEIPQIVRISFE